MIDRAGLGWLCSLCCNHACLNFGHCIQPNHYSAQRNSHQMVQYNSRQRSHNRVMSRQDLQTTFCTHIHPRVTQFNEEQIAAVFNGDDSIDIPLVPQIVPQQENQENQPPNP